MRGGLHRLWRFRIVCPAMALPPLRYVDAVRVDHEGDTYVVLHDPEGYVEQELMVSGPAFFIAAHLDGANDIAEIQVAFARQYGIAAEAAEIHGVVAQLEQAGYLASAPYFALKSRVEGAFQRSPERPAYLAGKSYPADPAALRHMIDGFFTREKGPGEMPGRVPGTGPCLSCLIVPHIDFHRGGHAYGHGYLRLYRHGPPKTVLLFGVAHCGVPAPFVLTRKAFDTPLGAVPVDRHAVDTLASACDGDPFAHEIVHRTEHSIEFQAVMLAYLYGTNVSIVPVLCSAFSDDPEVDKPGELAEVRRFVDACRDIVAAAPDTTTVIAGADLAHVGARFGDAFEIDDVVVRRVAERDAEDLAHASALRPEAFYASVMKDKNARRVCGLNCIYAALHSVSSTSAPGTILRYDYAHDPAGGIVSFAAGAFPRG